MPETNPLPQQLSAPPPAQPLTPPPPPTSPRLAGRRLFLFVVAIAAVSLCLLMFLVLHYSTHHRSPLPTWPLHAGDVLPLTPGDANIAKWAQDPISTGFVVQQLEANGHPLPAPTFCALEPDYMADAQQPGGTLTLLSQQSASAQQSTAAWRVRWTGGNTVPPFLKNTAHFEANCGQRAIILMTPNQLHALLDILAGIAASAPPPPPTSPPT